MAAPRLSEQTRQRLVTLLGEDRPDAARLISRLRALRQLERVPACAETVRLLVNVSLPEPEAEKLLQDILEHREVLSRVLKRDPGIRVAALDYLHNVERLLTNPTVIEMSQFEETERSAVTDVLTGLYNRRFFHMAIRRELRRSRRYRPAFSLVMLDLDEFKRVNDEFGHTVGDQVLHRVGRLIRRAVREADIACRYGGEEFAVITPETDRLGAWAVAERIRRAVRDGFESRPTGGQRVRMTISGGIASFPDDGDDAATLVTRADETLYRAKREGRNRILMHPSERRRSTRYPASPFARVAVRRDPPDPALDAVPINLSREGALLETEGDFRTAEEVGLLLAQDGGPDDGDVIRAQVVRVEPSGAGDRRRVRIGVAFASPIEERALRETIVWRPATRAARGGRS